MSNKTTPPLRGTPPLQGGELTNSFPAKGEYAESRRGSVLQVNNLTALRTFRKALRNNLTPAEAKLWTLLKRSQLEGRKFRRQHSVGHYILDFYCPSERLAIELDGAVHDTASAQEYDRERDIFLELFGIKVLRFENKLVFQQTEGVLLEIKSYFGWCGKQPPRPFGAPLLVKEGS